MKQFSLATIPLLCAAIAPLCADNVDNMISQANGNGSSSSQRMSDKQTQEKRQMESQKLLHQRLQDNAITPIANPQTEGSSWNPYITADFIWWKAYEDGLDFAWSGAPLAPTAVPPSATSGNMFRPNFKYEPGFKVGFGNKFDHDGWDLYAQYTWLRVNRSKQNEENCCEVENEIAWSNYWLPTNAGPEAILMNDESAKWKLSFNVLDLELGRDYYISKYLTMRPFVGMKFSWQTQKYHVDYDDVLFVQDQSDTPSSNVVIPLGSNYDIQFHQKELGIGIRAGLDTQWYFCKWLGLYGDVAVTGLWNRFHEKRTDTVSPIAAASYDNFVIKNKVRDVTGVLELGLGVFFEWPFHHDDYMFQLELGWENQIWFDQNQFITVETLMPGNLSLQGLTLKALFAF